MPKKPLQLILSFFIVIRLCCSIVFTLSGAYCNQKYVLFKLFFVLKVGFLIVDDLVSWYFCQLIFLSVDVLDSWSLRSWLLCSWCSWTWCFGGTPIFITVTTHILPILNGHFPGWRFYTGPTSYLWCDSNWVSVCLLS